MNKQVETDKQDQLRDIHIANIMLEEAIHFYTVTDAEWEKAYAHLSKEDVIDKYNKAIRGMKSRCNVIRRALKAQ